MAGSAQVFTHNLILFGGRDGDVIHKNNVYPLSTLQLCQSVGSTEETIAICCDS